MKHTIHKIFLATMSGIFGILAFPPFNYSVFGWISLVPILLASHGETRGRAFLYGYAGGVVFFSGVLYWLPNVTVPGAVVLVLVLAAFYGLFSLAASFVTKYSVDLFVLAFIWVVLEFVRANLFTGFPWALLGASQYQNHNIIQIADLTGVYGVSFLMVIFSTALFGLVLKSQRKISYIMIALLFILMATTYGRYRLASYIVRDEARISVVQGNIPQQYKWDEGFAGQIIDKYEALTRGAAAGLPDLIVWPETAFPYLITGREKTPARIENIVAGTGIPLLAGAVYKEGDVFYNAAFLFVDGEEEQIYRKNHLVPFGEYIPFAGILEFFRDFIDKPIGNFTRGRELTIFNISTTRTYLSDGKTINRRTAFLKFGAMICFEDVFPYLARGFVRGGADFLVNITNDAWFGRTSAAEQHLISSVFRAVENRVPVIRAANTGVSCFIDPMGRVYSRVLEDGRDTFIEGYDTQYVPLSPFRSFYTVYGDVFVYFCAFMILLIAGVETMRHKYRGKE